MKGLRELYMMDLDYLPASTKPPKKKQLVRTQRVFNKEQNKMITIKHFR